MITRILSALVFGPLIILFLVLGGIYLQLFTALIAIIGLYEFYKAFKYAKINTFSMLGYVFSLLYICLIILMPNTNILGMTIALSIIILFSYEIITLKYNVIGIFITLMGILYVAFLLSHIILLDKLQFGKVLVWLPFLTAWFADSFAYFVGVSMGKRKLCPKVSPKKSIEGAVGGLLGAVIFSIATGIIINRLGYSIALVHFAVIGALCGIVSQLGDLTASYIKRYTGIKDFGNLIPGHGGILDRFDSILFTGPIVYYYFFIVQNVLK